jgi:hypothetical protein
MDIGNASEQNIDTLLENIARVNGKQQTCYIATLLNSSASVSHSCAKSIREQRNVRCPYFQRVRKGKLVD